VIDISLPWPVHFCPGYPHRVLLAPAGAKKVELEIDDFYTIDSLATVLRILNSEELERRLADGSVMFFAERLEYLQPLIDREEQFSKRGLDVAQVVPPDNAVACDWCPMKSKRKRRAVL
jgi:hypothetical protein